MTKIIFECPAFEIIAPTYTESYYDTHVVPQFQAGDVFGMARKSSRGDTLYTFFTLGSVVSYALKNGQCPMRAVEQSKAHNHALHWASQNCVAITSHKEAKRTHCGLAMGDTIRFEGRIFTLNPAPNNNVELCEIDEDE